MTGMDYRCLYAPAHFGNTYEVMGPAETQDLLGEARWWGFNTYGDWFDSADLKDPAAAAPNVYLLPQAFMEQKVRVLSQAAGEGFSICLAICPNHVWLDQLAGDLLARSDDPNHIFGQLLCPSNPAARRIILDNHRYLFGLLRQAGVELESIAAAPYDYGGCACEKCRPWIVTFGRLVQEIHQAAREYFPAIAARLVGWWWTAQEHACFKEWADSEAPGLFSSLAKHIQYGQTRPQEGMVLPEGCRSHAFVHIGYADQAQPRDVYGPWGPVAAPHRIPETVRDLAELGATGYMAYSEGCSDDVNKALLAGLTSGKFGAAQEVLECYAERYFGAAGAARSDWADWLRQWGRPFEVDTAAARSQFDRLAPSARPGWRLAQFEAKLRILEAHNDVLSMKGWDARRLAAARRFLAEQERLYREVWKLGLVRHVLHPRYHRPAWFKEWQAAGGLPAGAGMALEA